MFFILSKLDINVHTSLNNTKTEKKYESIYMLNQLSHVLVVVRVSMYTLSPTLYWNHC